MSLLLELVDIVLPVFLVIGLGALLRAIGFLPPAANHMLTRLVFYVTAPILLFDGALTTPLVESLNLPGLATTAGVTVLTALGVYALSPRDRPDRRGVLAQGASRGNMVFMGLPLAAYAYGDHVIGPVSVTVGLMVVVYNVVSVLVLALPRTSSSVRDAAMWTDTLRRMALNPLVIGIAAGLVGSALGGRPPVAVERSLDLVGRSALPTALITVGAGLDLGRLRGDLPATALVSLLKLVIYPGLVLAGLAWLGPIDVAAQVLVLVTATPTAVVSFVMAKEMGGDETLAGAIVIGTTLASLLTLSGWLAVFRLFGSPEIP